MIAYYAHFMGIYDTPIEASDIKLLEKLGMEVINPNCDECRDELEALKGGDYMENFDKVFFSRVRKADVFAFRALPTTGKITAGVALELDVAMKEHKIIIELPGIVNIRYMSKEDTIDLLKKIGKR